MVTVSPPLLPVNALRPENVPVEKSTSVALVSTIVFPSTPKTPALEGLAGGEMAIGELDRVVARAAVDRVVAGPAGEPIGVGIARDADGRARC